jgi:LysM domain
LSARTGTQARIILSLAITGLFASVAHVSAQQKQEQQQQAVQPKIHVVKKGDTLWDLSAFYFTNPFLWPTIFEANRDVVEDPHWIYPDEKLRIPGVESGLPVAVTVEPAHQEAGPAAGPLANSQPNRPSAHTRFYTPPPEENSSRAIDMMASRQPLFAVTAAEFHSAAWLEDSTAIGVRARLLGLADPVSQHDRLPSLLHPFDRILFGRLTGGELVVGDSMMVIRTGGAVFTLGTVIEPVALVRIDSVNEQVASAAIVRQYGEARAGDALIPLREAPVMERGRPQPIENGAEGRLIAFMDREPLYGTMDDGFIDLGEEAGITVGDELSAYVPSRRDVRTGEMLPEEKVALLRVVKVMPRSSTVRVADAYSAALQVGVHVRVVRKMP